MFTNTASDREPSPYNIFYKEKGERLTLHLCCMFTLYNLFGVLIKIKVTL